MKMYCPLAASDLLYLNVQA